MPDIAYSSNRLALLGHSDLASAGSGGEGLALQQTRDGRRILWIAHERAPFDYTAVDVSDPRRPAVVTQTRLPHDKVRSNCLALFGDLLLVAYQTSAWGLPHAGLGLYDVAVPESPRSVAFFDTSGPQSKGVHYVWCVDGRYAHINTGGADFAPSHPLDDQFYIIVDVANPALPREAGRWWLPGTRVGDAKPPPLRHASLDYGFRPHNTNVYPERPDRAYMGYLDAGVMILDISNVAHPAPIARFDHHPPLGGFSHTAVPLFSRNLLVTTDEAVKEGAADWPKLSWVLDISHERNPVSISTLPLPSVEGYRGKPGRYGAHNLHENQPVPTAWRSDDYIAGAYFAGGIRVHDVRDPYQPREVASFVPAIPGNPGGTCQMNDVYVDERGLLYAVDRNAGGLFILEMHL